MNKTVVMTAIEKRMVWIFNNVILNPKNEGKDLTSAKDEIKDLYEAYVELRGKSNSVVNVFGVDTEFNNVDSIYQLTRE